MDRAHLREALADLQGKTDEIDDIVNDMLLPLRKRSLGHVLHARDYAAAHKAVEQILDYLDKMTSDEAPLEGGATPAAR